MPQKSVYRYSVLNPGDGKLAAIPVRLTVPRT